VAMKIMLKCDIAECVGGKGENDNI
jgi:hypothetical protein